MKVTFAPNNKETRTGVASFASWSNTALQSAIEQAFAVSPRERITEIIVERDGITAFFEPSSTAVKTVS